MMFKNIYLDRFNSKCHLWKTDGSYDVFDFKCRSFIETPDVPGCQYKTIKGVPVSPYYCSPNDERNRLNSGILNAESDVTLEIRVLSEYFEQTKDLSFKLEQFNIAYVDIETDVGAVFSGPDTVEQRINAITIFCTRSNKFVTFGLERDFVEHVYLTDEDMASGQFADGDEIVNEIDDEGRVTPVTKYYKIVPKKIVFTSKLAQKLNYTHEYVKCDTEKILLQKFFQHFSDNKPDAVSGWNCLSKNSRVWTSDRILHISDDIKNLKTSTDGEIKEHWSTGNKKAYKIKTINGYEIDASADHIFPSISVSKDRYFNSVSKIAKEEDRRVSDLTALLGDNNVYVKIDRHENTNKNYTYRDLLEYILKNDTNPDLNIFFTKDMHTKYEHIVRNDSEKYSYNKSMNYSYKFSVHNLRKFVEITNNEILEYIKNEKYIRVLFNKAHREIELDVAIPDDILQLLGMIYTDGTYDRKRKAVSFYNDDIQLLTWYLSTINELGVSKTKRIKNGKQGTANKSIRFSNNPYSNLILSLIYDKNKKKNINITNFSRLSYRQFVSFFSGCIDGDGWVTKTNPNIGFCNYNKDDISIFSELLLWNGVMNNLTRHSHHIYIPSIEYNSRFFTDATFKGKKKELAKSIQTYKHLDTKNKKKNHIYYDDCHWVKIKSISETEEVEMFDITTESHYFTSNFGIRTHNCNRYDLPYLINRSIKLGLNDYRKMSPVNRVYNIEKINDFKQKELHGVICGVSCLDMLEVFKKANLKQQESYKLGDVAQKELGTTKVDLGRHGLTLYRQGQNGFARHIEYNVTDVELLPQLEDKKHYLESLIAVAADARIPLQDFFVSKRVVLGFMLNYMHRKGLVIPNIGEQMSIPYEGAYICANPKHYKWGVSFDFKSLYPSIIASANISPETKLLADEEPRGPYSKSPIKGVYYDNSVLGIIPEIVTVLVEDRDKFKALQKKHSNPSVVEHYDPDLADYYKKKQEAYKIYANSIYGLLGNRYFQFFDVDNAASITGIGRYLIQYCIDYAIKWFDNALPTSEKFKEEFGEYANVTIKGMLDQNYINGVSDKTSLGKYKRLILAHTDSFFFDYSDIYSPFYRRKRTREEFDKLREKYCTEGSPTYDGPLATILNARDATGDWDEMTLTEFTLRFEICAFSRVRALIIDKWVKENNYRTNKLYLKLEKCCNHLIEMGPAHYICYLQYDEGDDLLHSDFEKRFKPVGVEIVKSDTPKWSKTKIKEVLKKVFDDEDKGSIVSLLSEYRADFKNPENIHLISKAISINSLQPSANGVLPAPRKGALKYNEIIGYSDDHNGYETISEGTKAKWIYVKEPNRFDTNVITYNTEKYPEFLNKYLQIDYNTQFEKVFQKTLSKIFECIGWGNIFEGDMDVLKKYTRKRNPE